MAKRLTGELGSLAIAFAHFGSTATAIVRSASCAAIFGRTRKVDLGNRPDPALDPITVPALPK